MAGLWEAGAAWVADYPGTRPEMWWRFDAPRPPLWTFAGSLWDGADAEALPAIKPCYDSGLPSMWIDHRDVAVFRHGGCGLPPNPAWRGVPKNHVDRRGSKARWPTLTGTHCSFRASENDYPTHGA
ncbi:hypothetical protein CPY51_09160 [Rhizobium tubonense]|uniref:Uncharacterized protein n=1 Tax=Rhizobium tubonense TaxID=484088 RepID=A0A2W4EMC1_9HYPH|nr:hypothetical protein CPY51_09160 [Rhizobium tubonense]